uniref:PRA1 family protein n=1 Tax=Ciona intestinalis TaxID=7719 RepID=H2XT41_CIOIN|nr:prenylated Rab acceptor protein 1-like [Ciona intestinalis]|eukprot:XP_002126562.1 prenylated Rab acceptor protein 1-like [Ciona intestinalis]
MTDSEIPVTEISTEGITGSLKKMNSPAAREWITQRRNSVRPWSDFINTNKFRKPSSISQWTKRSVKNMEHYQTNYLFVFSGLIIYCIITSPLLLIALLIFLGACYVIHVKNEKSNIKILGHEITHMQQYAVAGALTFPLFFVAGAGAAVFWVLGVSFLLVALHASFHISPEEGTTEDETPFMETV